MTPETEQKLSDYLHVILNMWDRLTPQQQHAAITNKPTPKSKSYRQHTGPLSVVVNVDGRVVRYPVVYTPPGLMERDVAIHEGFIFMRSDLTTRTQWGLAHCLVIGSIVPALTAPVSTEMEVARGA